MAAMSDRVNLAAGPEFLRWTALEQAEAIAKGELASVEVCGAYLQRIRRHNPELQAFVSVFERQALRAARRADQQRIRGGDLPVFHGVPTGVKDLVPLRMSRTMLGSRAFRYLVTPRDAPTGALIRRGGFVILGKLATSEFGVLPITEPDVHPPTRNPWDTGRSAGGSSGGSGAAVAGNLVPPMSTGTLLLVRGILNVASPRFGTMIIAARPIVMISSGSRSWRSMPSSSEVRASPPRTAWRQRAPRP